MPMSSPMMTTILGCFAPAACAWAVVPPPASMKLEMASAPNVSFRTPAPKSIVYLRLWILLGWPPRGEDCDGQTSTHQRARLAGQQSSPKYYAHFKGFGEPRPCFGYSDVKTSGQRRTYPHTTSNSRHLTFPKRRSASSRSSC